MLVHFGITPEHAVSLMPKANQPLASEGKILHAEVRGGESGIPATGNTKWGWLVDLAKTQPLISVRPEEPTRRFCNSARAILRQHKATQWSRWSVSAQPDGMVEIRKISEETPPAYLKKVWAKWREQGSQRLQRSEVDEIERRERACLRKSKRLLKMALRLCRPA